MDEWIAYIKKPIVVMSKVCTENEVYDCKQILKGERVVVYANGLAEHYSEEEFNKLFQPILTEGKENGEENK